VVWTGNAEMTWSILRVLNGRFARRHTAGSLAAITCGHFRLHLTPERFSSYCLTFNDGSLATLAVSHSPVPVLVIPHLDGTCLPTKT
jgi:hypothetical protein